MKNKDYNINRILLLTLVLLIAMTFAYFMYIVKSSQKVRIFDADSEKVVMTVFNPEGKIWEDVYRYPGLPCGAEYTFVVNNYESSKLTDWSVWIEFDGPFEIDSSWNGDYTVDGNCLYFTPDQEMSLVKVDDESHFGAVLYSHGGVLTVADYRIEGRMPLDPKSMPLTYVIFIMYLLWFIYLGSHIMSHNKIEKLQKQRDHDLEILNQSITTFTYFIDAKDRYTRNHSVRVAMYAKEIGRRLGLEEEDLQNLYYGTLLHDVGKIGIPDNILRNDGSLNQDEYEIIKTHPLKGAEMLKHFTSIPNISDCAHYHHERYDGTGYPEGLKGEKIPLFARIATVADAFDVMSLDRMYQKALDYDSIIAEFKKNSGSQFDPQLVPIIIEMMNDGFTNKVREEYGPN
ncbi:MAG: HD domain-containing protein [Saccharofermentans sp.]|nr:HD domain-containing protein [Saccharofermentans sp.]